jgi:DNA-binding CsgD family transcriptional regulator
MKNLLKIFALIAKNLSKTVLTLKEVEILKFSSTGFSSLMEFFVEG